MSALTLDRTKNECASDGVQEHDEKQEDVSEPFATPLGELCINPHHRLLAHAQTALGELVEALEVLRHEIAGTLGVHVLKELIVEQARRQV